MEHTTPVMAEEAITYPEIETEEGDSRIHLALESIFKRQNGGLEDGTLTLCVSHAFSFS